MIAWARANLDRQLSLDELAARALMSRRSFVRHFKAATGAAPHAWLLTQRLSLAEELLETTSLPVEQIAERVGYRSAAVFREQFAARRGLAPRDTGAPSPHDASGGGGDSPYESVIQPQGLASRATLRRRTVKGAVHWQRRS